MESGSWESVLTALGIAGHLAIWVLSTMILVPVTREEVQPDGSVHYVGGGNVVGYEYWGFIEEYRLQAIFALLVAALAVGVFCCTAQDGLEKGKSKRARWYMESKTQAPMPK